jgi:hypothetical protein
MRPSPARARAGRASMTPDVTAEPAPCHQPNPPELNQTLLPAHPIVTGQAP